MPASASRSVCACTRRERIERSRLKRPPVIAPPPVICSPRERHDRVAQAALAHQLDAGLQRVDDQHVADQEAHDAFVLAAASAPACARSRSRRACAPSSGVIVLAVAIAERIERQERRAARFAAIEELDRALGVFGRRA